MRRSRMAVGVFVTAAMTSFWWVAAAPSQGSTLTASITKVGWWSQQPGAQAQPQGGFQVALAATGPQSVAAVEVSVDKADGVTATLSLVESQSVASPSGAALQACAAATSTWKPDNPGAWGDQPPNDCSRKVDLQRDAASSSWKGDVSSLVTPGSPSEIMILPTPNPVGGLADPGFQLTFSSAKVEASGTTAADSTPAAGFDSGSSSSSPSSSSSSSSSGFSSTGSSSGSGLNSTAGPSSPSVAFGPSSPAAATAAPATPPPPSVASPAAPSTPAAAPPPPLSNGTTAPTGVSTGGPTQNRPWGRLVLFLPLAAIVGLGAAVLRRGDAAAIPVLGSLLGKLSPERS